MKGRERLAAGMGALLLALASYMVHSPRTPQRRIVLDDGCRTPLDLLEPGRAEPAGFAVVFHGLSANRRTMQTFGQRLASAGLKVYLVDSPGHGDSSEPFSFARTEQCAASVLESLARRGEIQPERTVIAGHSLGGGVAVRMADYFPALATIAISPAPMVPQTGVPSRLLPFPLPRRMPVNLLVVRGQWEPFLAAETASALVRAADGERAEPKDFVERRAMKLEHIPRATHTSLILDPQVARLSRDWIRQALTGSPATTSASPGFPVIGGVLGLAGILLALPFAATSVTTIVRGAASESGSGAKMQLGRTSLACAVAALLAVGLLKFWVPLGMLRLYTGDYLASFLLLTGVVPLAQLWRPAGPALRLEMPALVAACGFGLAAILALGVWLNWQLTDAWMNAARWLRFLPIVAVSMPYLTAEEIALGPPEPGGHWPRFGRFLLMRSILWLALVLALFLLGSGQVLILLLTVYLAAFSLLQRWCADMIRRRTGSVPGAALCQALLAAWFLAAVFPLT